MCVDTHVDIFPSVTCIHIKPSVHPDVGDKRLVGTAMDVD